MQLFILAIVVISAVDGDQAAFGETQRAPDSEVAGFAVGDGCELGQATAVVQPDMQLDRPLGRSEIGPREGREAQLDGAGIKRILKRNLCPRPLGNVATVS